jgi:hypothetical protein
MATKNRQSWRVQKNPFVTNGIEQKSKRLAKRNASLALDAKVNKKK